MWPCLLTILLAGIAQADMIAQPAEDHAEHELLARDLRLTLRVRQALQQDKGLAGCNIGVTANQGAVVLWGAVSSEVLAERAQQTARRVPGVSSVRSELSITPADGSPAPGPIAPIVVQAVPAPGPSQPWLPLLPFRSRKIGVRRRGLVMLSIMMPPIPLAGSSTAVTSVARTSSIDLPVELDRLRKGNDRFRSIDYSVAGGIVHLRGTAQHGEDLMDFAQEIAKLPGVERVILSNVRSAR